MEIREQMDADERELSLLLELMPVGVTLARTEP
jgi:hypothetical protein